MRQFSLVRVPGVMASNGKPEDKPKTVLMKRTREYAFVHKGNQHSIFLHKKGQFEFIDAEVTNFDGSIAITCATAPIVEEMLRIYKETIEREAEKKKSKKDSGPVKKWRMKD